MTTAHDLKRLAELIDLLADAAADLASLSHLEPSLRVESTAKQAAASLREAADAILVRTSLDDGD